MSDADPGHVRPSDPHISDVHGSADHGDAHGAGHGGHGAAESDPLGPIDVAAWGYALVGAALGLLVVIVLYVAST